MSPGNLLEIIPADLLDTLIYQDSKVQPFMGPPGHRAEQSAVYCRWKEHDVTEHFQAEVNRLKVRGVNWLHFDI